MEYTDNRKKFVTLNMQEADFVLNTVAAYSEEELELYKAKREQLAREFDQAAVAQHRAIECYSRMRERVVEAELELLEHCRTLRAVIAADSDVE